MLGTLRRDGSPRISPVEPYLIEGQLLVGAMAWSTKVADLRRDPRYVLHSAMVDPDSGEGEFKLYGSAVEAAANLRDATADAWWCAWPPEKAVVFCLHTEPVLYLLHGCCDSYLSWTRSTDVVRFFAARDVLVVMPDAGRVGFYSDWSRGPRWETFHLVELVRLLHQRYRASDVRAVAGVSMGGLGALNHAAQNPGMFPRRRELMTTPSCRRQPGARPSSWTPRSSIPE